VGAELGEGEGWLRVKGGGRGTGRNRGVAQKRRINHTEARRCSSRIQS